MLEAVLVHDVDAAAAVLTEHIRHTTDVLLETSAAEIDDATTA